MPNMNPQLAAQIKGGQALLDPEVQQQMGLPADIVNSLLERFAHSIIVIFQWSVILPVAAMIFALLLGRARLMLNKSGPGRAGSRTETGSARPAKPASQRRLITEAKPACR